MSDVEASRKAGVSDVEAARQASVSTYKDMLAQADTLIVHILNG